MTYHSKKQYTVNEVADLLGVSSRKIYYLIKDGSLPSTKFGGSRRISGEQLDKYISDHQKDG